MGFMFEWQLDNEITCGSGVDKLSLAKAATT